MDGFCIQDYESKRRSDVVEWLNSLFPELSLPVDASEEELRSALVDGSVLCRILSRANANFTEESQHGSESYAKYPSDNLQRFLSAVDELGLAGFNVADLEQGSVSAVVECLLGLKNHINFDAQEGGRLQMNSLYRGGSFSRKRWKLAEGDRLEDMDFKQGNFIQNGEGSLISEQGRSGSFSTSEIKCVLRSPVRSEPSAALLHHAGQKFHEVFQMRQGCNSDLPIAKISEMMKSCNLDSASTHSLLSIVNGILDESNEKKNGEIPQRVAQLLRKVVQEIECRISKQNEHIQQLNNIIRAREEKYQLRTKALETLAAGTTEESQIAITLLQDIKSERSKIEEQHQHQEQEITRLVKEKESCDITIAQLKKEMELFVNSHEQRYIELENKSKQTELILEKRIKDVEFHLSESRKRTKELEAFSESRDQCWNRKESIYQNFLGFQSQSLGELRMVSNSTRKDLVNVQRIWEEEFTILGRKLKGITDAAENYHSVLSENRRLYNEVQELKGNIRVYCRIRPFLPGQNRKTTTVDYIGENGELLIANPSKQGKDGHRMFKFNKVFGPAASQEEVFLDTQPLIRSALDGYSVCIFAYGQTGSGKTYTMSGPNALSKEDWGVNYRALNDLFHISRTRRNSFIYEVGVQMVEIYNEQVRDLLSNDSSQKRLGIWSSSQPNGLAVPDASMHMVRSTSDVLELMQIGEMNRAVGATALNERSSRSHSVLTVHVRGTDLESGANLRGCLNLVDLAGSERVDRSEAAGERLKEAQHINKSLSALGDVIFALAQKSPHVPYRNSKLTQVLQSSLGGQAKTLMFVQINPDVESYSETVSTLKFAERVSGVELGAAKSNKEGKDIRDMMEQVASLKDVIARKDEEIQRLQLIKDVKPQYSSLGSRKFTNKLERHLSSSPGRSSLGVGIERCQRPLGGKPGVLLDKAASDPEICSEYSDKNSESGSLQSMEDFKQRDAFCQSSATKGNSTDIQLLEFGEGDSEERLSDISDSGLSMGTETDGSISSVVEYTLFPEVGKPVDDPKQSAVIPVSSRIPRPPSPLQKSSKPAFGQSRLKDSKQNSSTSRRSSISQVASSATRSAKRWQ